METWKDVIGYDEYYQVSNLGNVRNKKTGQNLKPILKRTGYLTVDLAYKGVKTALIHRLVAEAFIPNPLDLPQVNLKDEVKTNNTSDNLEWCTSQYNVNYGYGSLVKNTGVLQFDADGKCIRVWSSMKEAAEALGIKYQGISRVCRRERKTCGGYIWRYLPEFEVSEDGSLCEKFGGEENVTAGRYASAGR